MTNLFRHPETGVYYFRKTVPKPLRAIIGKWEIKVSLRTKDLAEAKRRAIRKAVEVEAQLRQAAEKATIERRDSLSSMEIEHLIAQWKAQQLEEDEELRRDGGEDGELYEGIRAQVLTAGGTVGYAPDEVTAKVGLSERAFTKHGGSIELTGAVAKRSLARGDTRHIEFELNDLLERNGISLKPDAEAYRRLAYEMLKADVEVLSLMQQRHDGELIETPKAVPVLPKASASGSSRNRISTVYNRWKAETAPPLGTETEYEYALRRFKELHGDLDVAEITKVQIVEFKDAMLQLPPRMSTEMRSKALPDILAELVANPPAQRLNSASVNKYLSAIRGLLTWAIRNALLISNPASGVTVPLSSSRADARVSYTDEDVRTMLSFPIFTKGERPKGGRGEASVWLPVLALFTGARLEELSQLSVSDVREEKGIAYFDMTTIEDGKHRKNRGSARRRVPLHPKLIDAGFLRYVESLRTSGAGAMLFNELTRNKKGVLSASWSQWWGRYARDNGITDKRKVFHSLRHTFKDACRRAEIAEEHHDALTGHGTPSVGRRYGSAGIPVAVLYRAISMIEYPGAEIPVLVDVA